MTTTMMMTPRATSARFGSTPRPSMIAGIRLKHIAASTGPSSPPTAAHEGHPAEHDRRDAVEGRRRPDRGAWLTAAGERGGDQPGASRSGTRRPRRSQTRLRATFTPARKAAFRSLPIA